MMSLMQAIRRKQLMNENNITIVVTSTEEVSQFEKLLDFLAIANVTIVNTP
jgi:hypothetical protein